MQNAIAHYEQTDPALYKTLTDRVRKQSIPVRYMIIKIYGNDYSDAVLLKMKQDFRADCEYYNLTESAEGVNITTLWETWGIA